MNKTLLLAGVAACMFAANANAADFQSYVSGKLTYSDMSNDFKYADEKENADDNVWGASLAYGVKADAMRTELELNLNRDSEKKHSDEEDSWKNKVENNSVMLNAYYDIDTGTKFTPYVGAGIGIAHLKAQVSSEDARVSKSKNNFAWQVGAGVAYAVTDNVAIDLGYRYTDSGDLTLRDGEEKAKVESEAQEILLGARYMF